MSKHNQHFFKQYAGELIKNGYSIIPIPKGCKYPKGYDNWREIDFNDIHEQLSQLPDEVPGVGIKLGKGLVAIDIDSKDRQIVDRVIQHCEDHFGHSPVRFGDAPKAMLFYRVMDERRKGFSKKFIDGNGAKHEIEILGDGQQAVVYAEHPDTGYPYYWEQGELAKTEFKSLPVIDDDDIDELINLFNDLALEQGYKEKPRGKSQSSSPMPTTGHVLDHVKAPRGLSYKEMYRRIKLLDPDMDHDDWVKVGMAVFHESGGSATGKRVWEKWSALAPHRYEQAAIDEKWPSFHPDLNRTNPVTWGTVEAMIAELTIEKVNDPLADVDFFMDLGEYAKNTPAVDWLITDYIEDHTTGVLFGDPGSYKSFLSIDIALHIATGLPWHGHPVKQGPAVLIEGEGRQGVGKRARVWTEHHGQDITGKAFISTTSASLMEGDGAIELMNHIKRLRRQINENPRIIVIDTLARNFGAGDENATLDMNQFIRHVDAIRDEFKCTVLIVHHTNKASKIQPRGNSALVGACDFMYRTETDAKMMAKLVCLKMKDADQPDNTYFKGTELEFETADGGFNTSLYFEKTEAQVVERKELNGKQLDLFKLIQEMCEEGAGSCDKTELLDVAIDLEIYASRSSARSGLRRIRDNGWVETTEKRVKTLEEDF